MLSVLISVNSLLAVCEIGGFNEYNRSAGSDFTQQTKTIERYALESLL